MAYFQITLTGQQVSCFNGNDGAIDLVNSSPNPPYNYQWLNGPGLQDAHHIVTPSGFINALNVWQSFRPTFDGIMNSLEINVNVTGPSYSGIIQIWEGQGVSGQIISFHNHTVPGGTVGRIVVDLLSAPFLETGKDYTFRFVPFSGTLNIGIDIAGGYINGFAGGGSVPTGADLIFEVQSVANNAGNIISTQEDLTGLSPGKYSVVVIDNVGDIGFGGVRLDNPPQLLINPNVVQNPTHPVAFDGKIEIDVVGGQSPYQFNWTNGEVTQNIYGLGNGSYTVVVQDSRGCIQNMDFTLTSNLGSLAPQVCPGKVIEPRLIIAEGENGHYLTVLDQNYTRVLSFQIDTGTLDQLAELLLGGNGTAGQMIVKSADCKDAICLDGHVASIIAGCEFLDGEIIVRDRRREDIIRLDGASGSIFLGGNNVNGDLRIFTQDGDVNAPGQNAAFHFDADTGILDLNGNFLEGGKAILKKQGQDMIIVNGDLGEIEITNADFAEDFDIAPALEAGVVDAGMVMVFDPEGKLRPCTQAGDPKVAGIISGAGDFKPGIVMDKRKSDPSRKPIALAGKAYCYVETFEAAIEAGDLLTTSHLRGHAKKAVSPANHIGAIIGKALKGMEKGKSGLIPVKVGLM